MTEFQAIAEYNALSPKQFFSEIVPLQRPIVIRGFCRKWPFVEAAHKGHRAWIDYLLSFYTGQKAAMVVAPPSENRRFFYNADMTGVNFIKGEERLDLFLGRLLELVDRDTYPAISMQNAFPETLLPGFIEENASSFFPTTNPRLWIGNEGIVSTHFDGSDNLACVVNGRRRFTLFPPEQTANLYPGPVNFTPAGAPTSLVDLENPDFERFPLFRKALENGFQADLEAGDAIFIPMLWWHHVVSQSKVNALMNYWWNGSYDPNVMAPTAIDSLNLALLAMRDFNAEQRNAWKCLFDHYLFKQGVEPTSYIPEHQHHLLGDVSEEYAAQVKAFFIQKLKNQ